MSVQDEEWDIFISYAKEDLVKAEALHDLLAESAGVFLNTRSAPLDEKWRKVLPRVLKQTLITVPLISSHSSEAHYHEEEVSIAIENFRKDSKHHAVIPVYLEDPSIAGFENIFGLGPMTGLYLSQEKSLEKIALRLLHALYKKKEQLWFEEVDLVRPIDKLSFSNEVNGDISTAKEVTILANWLPQWIHNASLQDALAQGANVCLIFMASESSSLKQRSSDLGHGSGWGAERLQGAFTLLKELFRKVGPEVARKNLSIRVHDFLPSALIIRCDSTYYVGVYFHDEAVSDTFIMRIRDGAQDFLIGAIKDELNRMHGLSRPIDLTAQ